MMRCDAFYPSRVVIRSKGRSATLCRWVHLHIDAMSLAVVDQRYATADQNAAIKGNLDHSGAVGLVVGDGNRVTARTAAQLRAVAGPVARQARRPFPFIAGPFQPEQRFHPRTRKSVGKGKMGTGRV